MYGARGSPSKDLKSSRKPLQYNCKSLSAGVTNANTNTKIRLLDRVRVFLNMDLVNSSNEIW